MSKLTPRRALSFDRLATPAAIKAETQQLESDLMKLECLLIWLELFNTSVWGKGGGRGGGGGRRGKPVVGLICMYANGGVWVAIFSDLSRFFFGLVNTSRDEWQMDAA